MPKISDIEETPNPNAVKFILREPVTNGVARQFPILRRKRRLIRWQSFVSKLQYSFGLYMDSMVTVEKEDTADWTIFCPRWRFRFALPNPSPRMALREPKRSVAQ